MTDSAQETSIQNEAQNAPLNDWKKRKEEIFYKIVELLVNRLGAKANSIIDIGSGKSELISEFNNIDSKTTLDKRYPYTNENIQSIRADFLTWVPAQRYDVVICLQTIDQFSDPKFAAEKLLKLGKVIIISFTSARDGNELLSDEVVIGWFGRSPNFKYTVREINSDIYRNIMVFDKSDKYWTSFSNRSKATSRIDEK